MRLENLGDPINLEVGEDPRLYYSEDFLELLEINKQLPKGEPETYGATPLDRMSTLEQQLELSRSLQELTYRDIPHDVPMEIADYVHRVFVTRFHKRAEANEENYMTALRSKEQFTSFPEVMGMFERGETGYASPSELLAIRTLRGIRSVELACVTHPYGKRMEYLDEMRKVVRQHVEKLDGIYFEEGDWYNGEQGARYRVKDIVGYEKGQERFDKGLLMTRKRDLAEMQDGTIIRERSSFVLRLDKDSPITQETISALENVDLTQGEWQDELVRKAKLDEVVVSLLENDEHSLAIPVSTTIYAYNMKTAWEVEARQRKLTAQRRAVFAREFPEIFKAIQKQHNSSRVFEDRNGIFYVGPAESEEPAEPSDEALDV